MLDDEDTDDHAEPIITAADQLAAIGARARTTDQIRSIRDTQEVVRIDETLREVVASMGVARSDVTVTTELPTTPALTTSGEAVWIAVESALETATDHAKPAVTVAIENCSDGYVVTVDDDGPGVPEEKLAPLEARTKRAFGRVVDSACGNSYGFL